jgi:peroxiredoxin Q/BCP
MAMESGALPQEGKALPAFSLLDEEGNQVSLKTLKGKAAVLYFYPKDNTSGCTVEAKEFRDLAADFEAAGAAIYGISPDDAKSHCKFRDKFELNFRLLCDTDHKFAESLGLWVEKSMYGRKYMGVQRATILLDKSGKVAKFWPKVSPSGHAAEVLEAVRAL